MSKIAAVLTASLFAATLAFAKAPVAKPAADSMAAPATASDCEIKAVGKNGKPLAGAAKAAFLKKCEAGAKKPDTSGCEAKAVGKNGKPLVGAAKASFMKKCAAESAR